MTVKDIPNAYHKLNLRYERLRHTSRSQHQQSVGALIVHFLYPFRQNMIEN